MFEPNGSRGDSAGDVSKVQAQRFICRKRTGGGGSTLPFLLPSP